MLVLKSFKMDQEKEMNELLSTHRLAKGASVFVSNGDIIIPIEDGEVMNTAQRLVQLKEERNMMAETLAPIEHSQRVLERQREEITGQITRLEETLSLPKSKKDYDEKKKLNDKLSQLKNMSVQMENQYITNTAEIDRINLNIEIFNDTISDLENFPVNSTSGPVSEAV